MTAASAPLDDVEAFRSKAWRRLRAPRKTRKRRAKAAPVALPPPVVHYPARRAVVRAWTLCRARREGPPHVMSRDPLAVTCPACIARMNGDELQLSIGGFENEA